MSTLNGMRSDDIGKLMLRLAVGGLMLFHGIAKVRGGVGFIVGTLEQTGLPGFLAYGTYIAEFLAPVLIIIGFATRPAAAIVAFDMVMAVVLMLRGRVFATNPAGGGWAIELEAFFLLASVALVFLGSGRFAVSRGRGRWD